MKRIQELRTMSNEQLNNRLNEIRISIRRFQAYNKGRSMPPKEIMLPDSHEKTSHLYNLKRTQARILTLLNERELAKNAKKV